MSQAVTIEPSRDRVAAAAVVAHHAQLAGELHARTEALLAAVEHAAGGGGAGTGPAPDAALARAELVRFARTELLPHAQAEEGTLYRTAAGLPGGEPLIRAMLAEHGTIAELVDQVAALESPIRAAAAGRALATLFDVHLSKENDLVVPMVLGAPDVSLADLLDGMHAILGDHASHDHDHGHDHGHEHDHGHHDHHDHHGHDHHGHDHDHGHDHADDATAGLPEAPVLSDDPRLDVRAIPHARRHAMVIGAAGAIKPGQALVLVAHHAPRPVLAEVQQRYPGQFTLEWLQEGPEVWQVRLRRAGGDA